eukprot:6192375-Pleurochrysis_carterae.AAC.2
MSMAWMSGVVDGCASCYAAGVSAEFVRPASRVEGALGGFVRRLARAERSLLLRATPRRRKGLGRRGRVQSSYSEAGSSGKKGGRGRGSREED